MVRRASLLAVTIALLSACETHEECSPSMEVTGEPTTIMSGDTVTLTIRVEDFTPEEPTPEGRLEKPGFVPRHGDESGGSSACAGHYHVYLDDLMSNPILQGYEAETDVIVEADPGPHTLFVRLNGADHKIVEPEVTDSVDITVE